MRILVATDAWHPQVNGVVRTLTMMAEAAKAFGVDVGFLTPQSFHTFAMPSYRDLRVALPYPAKIAQLIAAARPDSIHIATEGPIGLAVRRYCRRHAVPFTTSFHTRFPEYISARLPIPEAWIWAVMLASAVVRGTKRAIVVGDMPFGSFQVSDEAAVENAVRFVKDAGVDAVWHARHGHQRSCAPQDCSWLHHARFRRLQNQGNLGCLGHARDAQ